MRKASESLREKILWSAREVFMEQGYERASMDAIAKRAKTTKRTVYAHFENKQTLFLAVFEFLKSFFLGRLRTPDFYSRNPEEALVQFCGRFLETLLFEGAIRMCRVCAAEASRFPSESAEYCYVVFSEVEMRVAAYLRLKFGLSQTKSEAAAERLIGQVLHPRFTRTLFGVDPMIESFDEAALSPKFNLKPIRKAVENIIRSLPPFPAGA